MTQQQQAQAPGSKKLPELAGRVIGNTAKRLFTILQGEAEKADAHKQTLTDLKAGTIDISAFEFVPEPPPIRSGEMVGDLLITMVGGYLGLIEEESAKRHEYQNLIWEVVQGNLDPATLTITDDGVTIVPPMEEEEPELPPDIDPSKLLATVLENANLPLANLPRSKDGNETRMSPPSSSDDGDPAV